MSRDDFTVLELLPGVHLKPRHRKDFDPQRDNAPPCPRAPGTSRPRVLEGNVYAFDRLCAAFNMLLHHRQKLN